MLMKEIRRDKLVAFKFDEAAENVTAKAAAVLGYKGVEAAREKVATLKPLAAVLADLGIDPLNAVDVATYQRERAMETTRRMLDAFEAREKVATGTHVLWFTGANWEASKIENYKAPVPIDVLARLVSIKEACPDVIVEIVHLTETPDPFARVSVGGANEWERKETYWVDVWDEPRFMERPQSTDEIPF